MAEHLSINTTSLSVPAAKVKFSINPVAVNDLELGEQVMLGARSVIKNVTSEYGMYIDMKSYSTMYSYYEMVGITFDETIVNLITSAIAVMIVLFCLLPPGPSILAVLNVLLADICILAWVPLTGLNLNAITSTCMVMSVGIAVDFSAHITHAFVETDGSLSGKERAAMAVTKMGRSLTTSALTTFMSVLMLSTVTVPSNRMFFVMMSGVTLFGLLFGMLLLPTVLSFFNPGYEAPVPVVTPVTPLKPGEEAERLDKMRSRGVRRHHRKHHKKSGEEDQEDQETEEKKEQGEEEKEEEGEAKKELKELEMKTMSKEEEEEKEEERVEEEQEEAKKELKELEMKEMSKEEEEEERVEEEKTGKEEEPQQQFEEQKEFLEEKPVQDELNKDDSLEKQSIDVPSEVPESPSTSEPVPSAEGVKASQVDDAQPEPSEEPASETAESANETVEPANETVEPANETVEPANEIVGPTSETVEPTNQTPDQTELPASPNTLKEESPLPEANEAEAAVDKLPATMSPHEDVVASPKGEEKTSAELKE